MRSILHRVLVLVLALAATTVAGVGAQGDDPLRFKSGVDLVNVTATVTDSDGHFVSGLTKDDFFVYEDGQLQDVTNFSNERVPVSLGILLDTSGSMTSDKMASARGPVRESTRDTMASSTPISGACASSIARARRSCERRSI